MCRILYVTSPTPFECSPLLTSFAEACQASPEYQGHGWGIATRLEDQWELAHSLTPIWEDNLTRFGTARGLLVHARSAFRDEGITVENNMPFEDDGTIFAFNGELHGVRIQEQGRIGAEKIFKFLHRRYQSSGENWERAIAEGARVIASRSRRVRAMNLVLVKGNKAYAYSTFDERPEYFTMYLHRGNLTALCSVPLREVSQWEPLPQRVVYPLEP